jgi:hypothetical protein
MKKGKWFASRKWVMRLMMRSREAAVPVLRTLETQSRPIVHQPHGWCYFLPGRPALSMPRFTDRLAAGAVACRRPCGPKGNSHDREIMVHDRAEFIRRSEGPTRSIGMLAAHEAQIGLGLLKVWLEPNRFAVFARCFGAH